MVQSMETGAFRFLDLPRELRDRIYAMVLTSERQPPASPEQCGGRWRDIDASTMRRYNIPNGPERYRDIWYENQPMATACAGVLSCSRQISQEMVEAIEWQNTAGRGGLQYKLDCMVRDERLWPTWTALPAPVRYLECLELAIRVFPVVDEQGQGIKSIDKASVGGLVTSLLTVLCQFVTRGAQFTCSVCNSRQMAGYSPILCHKCAQKAIKVGILDVNCVRALEHTKPLDLYSGSHVDHSGAGGLCGFGTILGLLAKDGLMFGKIDLIRLHYDGNVREWKSEDAEASAKIAIAKLWAPYGWTPGDLI